MTPTEALTTDLVLSSDTQAKPSNVISPHWERAVKKVIYLLNVTTDDNPEGYQPRVRRLTYPLIERYAKKIGADVIEIRSRQFPEFPITYEKLQIHQISQQIQAEWNIYIDVDAMVNPELFDVTVMLPKDTVCHNGRDMANMRWKYDKYFLRDGRHFGSCNWFTVASDWCVDLWKPLDDITCEQALANINITTDEYNSRNCKTEHLIDDYSLSRNIAKYGLKATTMMEVCAKLGYTDQAGRGVNPYLWHIYTKTEEEKLQGMLNVLSHPNRALIPDPRNPQMAIGQGWGLMDPSVANQLREEWGLPR